MERYRVETSPAALKAIEEAFEFIHGHSPQNAINWLGDLYRAVDSLETMPERCGVIRENDSFDVEVRELLHYSHRIIFSVDADQHVVRVHAVRHAARDDLADDELEPR